MLRSLIFVVGFCLVRADRPISARIPSESCKDGGNEADRISAGANAEMVRTGEDNVSVDFYGLDAKVGAYFLGMKLPVEITLSVSHGNLAGAEKMKRVSDAVSCSTSNTNSLEGLFGYTPEVSLSYANASAKFLFWEIDGTFSFKLEPKIRVFLLNETSSCRVESMTVEDTGPLRYEFHSYEESTMSTFISKMLVSGLEQRDDTSMMKKVELWIQAMIGTYFALFFCHPEYA